VGPTGGCVATADTTLAALVPTVARAVGSDVAAVDTCGAVFTVAVAGTGVQGGSGVGLAVTVTAICPPLDNGPLNPEVADVAVGGSGVGDGEGEGDAVPPLAVTVGGAVGVTHAGTTSVAAPASPTDHPRNIASIPAVNAAPMPTTALRRPSLCPSIPLPLIPRRNHSLYLAE
jgi:hypothetical protein